MAFAELHVDAHEFAELARLLEQAGAQAPVAIRRSVNRAGDMARTQVVRALTAQTGLKRKVIDRAVRRDRAPAGGLVYTLRTRGGDVALKYFGARETREGVSAAPWGERKVFATTFIKGGRFPNRVALALGGQVFERVGGAKRLPIAKVKSGLFIPTEMVKGATAEAFLSTVNAVLPVRLDHELGRLLRK